MPTPALDNLNPEEHTEILHRYNPDNKPWWQIPDDGYLYDHLAEHLLGAGRQQELYTLLTESAPDGGPNPWMEAKFAACVGDASYAADLALAIADFADPLKQDQVLILTQLQTARQIISTRKNSYTYDDFKIMVYLGRESEALAYARAQNNPSKIE